MTYRQAPFPANPGNFMQQALDLSGVGGIQGVSAPTMPPISVPGGPGKAAGIAGSPFATPTSVGGPIDPVATNAVPPFLGSQQLMPVQQQALLGALEQMGYDPVATSQRAPNASVFGLDGSMYVGGNPVSAGAGNLGFGGIPNFPIPIRF